ncbi:MAG TPA: ABC transporter ATP-binding protein, partial [Candidatus Saccharimonadia bacterium]|nr:ABC transporter ATP-binding protein [Candidatus Saccharimonadia bacterium]
MIRLESIQKRYGATTALDGLTLEVAAGEVFGLLGPNGAGKSTAMKILTGLVVPDAGSVSVCGGSPVDPAIRRKIGFAPQSLALYPLLSGRENVEFFGRMYGLEGAALARRVDAVLEFVQLSDRQRDRVKGYSGGMQRRLNLAAALVHEPELVLLDEATAGVDPQSRHAIFELVKALRAQGRTVVYTTHYMEEAARLCDRIAVVDHGRVLAHGSLDELVLAPGGEATLVVRRGSEETREAAREALARLNAIAAEGTIDEFRLERPTLELVFLNLT